MVDVSGEVTEFDSALGGGIKLHSTGPVGRSIQAAHGDAFLAEIKRLIELEDGIELHHRPGGTPSIFIPDSEHAYWFYSGLAEEVFIDTDLWTAHVVVTYATDENGYYQILSEKNKVGVYRNPQFCAALALNAIKAHRAAGFTELPTEPQYNLHDRRLLDGVGRR